MLKKKENSKTTSLLNIFLSNENYYFYNFRKSPNMS